MDALNATINNLLNLGAVLGLGLCGLYLAFGGLKITTSRGSPAAQESGKTACYDACIGLGVVLMARVIAGIISGAIVR